MNKLEAGLKKKTGPLPRWAWLAILLAIGGVAYLRWRSNQQQSQAQNVTDPYSSYNTSGYVDQGYPYGATDTAGAYPADLTGGGGFDPTSFDQGIQYGQSLNPNGNSLQPVQQATDTSVPTNGGSALPIPSGDTNITVNEPGNPVAKAKSVVKKAAAKVKKAANGSTQAPRTTTTHTKKPATGTHKTTGAHKLGKGTGSSKPKSTPIRTAKPKTTATGSANVQSPHPGVGRPVAAAPKTNKSAAKKAKK